MLTFVEAIKICLRYRYFNFHDRATRSEFWWFFLFSFIVNLALGLLEGIPVLGPLVAFVVSVGLIIPTIAVSVRRLHDINRTGWWLLAPFACGFLALISALFTGFADDPGASLSLTAILGIVSVITYFAVLIFMVLPGTKGDNRYGVDPLDVLKSSADRLKNSNSFGQGL